MKKNLFPIAGLMALTFILLSATSCVNTCKSLTLEPAGDRVA